MKQNVIRLGILLMASLSTAPSFAEGSDSPWLEITNSLNSAVQTGRPGDVAKILETQTPKRFWENLETEAKETKLTSLWGRSINFDEGAKAIIVTPEILDYLFAKFNVVKREDRHVHAGVEHVYGYLFSNLVTPFGYKRARWIQPDIERGFGLPENILNPLTQEGSLLTNVTYFFGKIAFEGVEKNLYVLKRDRRVPKALKGFPFASLRGKRVVEKVSIPEEPGRTVELRTDFIPFTMEKGANSVLLIYSIFDSKIGTPLLISGFPVAQSFLDEAIDPKLIGENMPIKTKYNAYVEGFTGTLNGTREVLSIHE